MFIFYYIFNAKIKTSVSKFLLQISFQIEENRSSFFIYFFSMNFLVSCDISIFWNFNFEIFSVSLFQCILIKILVNTAQITTFYLTTFHSYIFFSITFIIILERGFSFFSFSIVVEICARSDWINRSGCTSFPFLAPGISRQHHRHWSRRLEKRHPSSRIY